MTTPPRCRTARSAPGSCRAAMGEEFGAGGYVGRACGRDLRCAKTPALSPVRRLDFSMFRSAPKAMSMRAYGCASAKSNKACRWSSKSSPSARTAPISVSAEQRRRRGPRLRRGVSRRCSGVGADRTRENRALPLARSVVVSMAAAGGRHRGQHRRRLPALQQVVQLLLFGA